MTCEINSFFISNIQKLKNIHNLKMKHHVVWMIITSRWANTLDKTRTGHRMDIRGYFFHVPFLTINIQNSILRLLDCNNFIMLR